VLTNQRRLAWATREPPPPPSAGRGIAMCAMQDAALTQLLEKHDGGPVTLTRRGRLRRWCAQHMRPWVEDHIEADITRAERFRGADLDLDRLTTADIAATADADPALAPAGGRRTPAPRRGPAGRRRARGCHRRTWVRRRSLNRAISGCSAAVGRLVKPGLSRQRATPRVGPDHGRPAVRVRQRAVHEPLRNDSE
jgi:hypothetical protein